MVNSDINSSGLGKSRNGMAALHKQPPIAMKKVALRDVNNNGRNPVANGKEISLLCEERLLADTAKVCGTKRPTPEYPSIHTSPPVLSNNGVNEHFMYGRGKFESEAIKGRIQANTHKFSDCAPIKNVPELHPRQTHLNDKNFRCPPFVTPNQMSSMMTHSYSSPPVPNFLGKTGNVKAETTQVKGSNEQQRRERFLRLQNYLKHCDESNQRENIQMLLLLSPAELSKRAVELEKRAIQLALEEGKEMQRMEALNILGKSAPSNHPSSHTTQQLQPKT